MNGRPSLSRRETDTEPKRADSVSASMDTRSLENFAIASPCSADWNQMDGDERRRFCAQCRLHVHDLSAMTRDEVDAMLRSAGPGRLCVRLFRRADGRVLTRDCPTGLRVRMRRARARIAALWLTLWAGNSACSEKATDPVPDPAYRQLMGEWVEPQPPQPEKPATPPLDVSREVPKATDR